ncbi:MAG: iron-containing alcohol dehydrogenase [Candidimonas sp.]|nr:MAG: iron-containing alcohol dehydrogenase [Candidimonas sp.]
MPLPLANWNYPTTIKAGPGRIRELPGLCRSLGMRRPLLITDPGLAALAPVTETLRLCREADMPCGLFSQIKGNPTGRNINDGTAAFRAGGYDGVIGLGGGSALDAAKAVALMTGQTRPLWDFEDANENYTRVDVTGMAPVIAIPTTAGTGSEVGRASVIVDESTHVKRIIFHPRMLPAIVILDPNLTTALPARLTAATGMDALSHNIEALSSPFYHPMATGIGMEGCRLIHEYLERAVADGHDLDARNQMLVASSMGATAFQKGLGAIHALAHPLGAVYDAHHGTLCAILMPYVLKANESRIADTMERLARYLNLPGGNFRAMLDRVLALRETIRIPHTLREIGIPADAVGRIGAMAVNDPSAASNPIAYTATQYDAILRCAIEGTV